MTKAWLLAIGILLVQEVVSLNALLLETHHGHYELWLIHSIFVAATVFDIWTGDYAGRYAKKKITKGKVVAFAQKISDRFHRSVGRSGRRAALLLLGTLSFPYVNSFVSAWLDIPLRESFGFLFLGNMISYTMYWIIVLGVSSVIPNPFIAFPIMVTILGTVLFIAKRFRS